MPRGRRALESMGFELAKKTGRKRPLGLSEERVQKQRKIIEGRLLQKKTWFDKSCQRWGLSGEWRPRGRKIYYAVMVAAELQLLTVLLEEIFPVVDVIILQESRHMWRTGHTEEKELLFQKYNRCALTFGHKYNFQCTALAPAGHYHPDLTTGRCLRDLGGEELRMFYGGDWNNLYKVGPVGWHMMSFLSDHFLLFKQFTRSGPTGFTGKWHAKDMEKIIEMKRGCNEFANIFKHDAWGCMPLPHLIREEPKQWRHFIEYVDVVDYPDPLGLESWVRRWLEDRRV
eukprot:gene424-785_t